MATLFDSIEFDSGTPPKNSPGHVRRLQRVKPQTCTSSTQTGGRSPSEEFKTNAIRFHLSEGHAKLVLDEALQRLRASCRSIQAVHMC